MNRQYACDGFVDYIDHMGSDLRVANAARVSFDTMSDWELDQLGRKVLKMKDKKLLNYLAKHNHWTPFAHPQITVRIRAPFPIRTQLFKHKVGFVENEISRRYVKDMPSAYIPFWRTAPQDGAKQGSHDFMDKETTEVLDEKYRELLSVSADFYQTALDSGTAPEQARFGLLCGHQTEWFWTGSLAGFARVCNQRSDPHAQWEVRMYAEAISAIIEPLFPISWKALHKKKGSS